MPTSESIKHAITSCISHSLRQQFSKAATMIRCIGVIVATLLIARDISVANGQALCFDTCGDDATLQSALANNAPECCNMGGVGAYLLVNGGPDVCQFCSDLAGLQFGFNISVNPSPLVITQDATFNCDIELPASVTDATANVTWFAPDGSVAAQGTVATPDLNFPREFTPFTIDDIGTHTCSATVSVPGRLPVTGRSTITIDAPPGPTSVNITDSGPPEVGQPYTLTCSVNSEGQDIQWLRGSDQTFVTSDPANGIILGDIMSGSGVTTRSLTFTSLQVSDTDIYTCDNLVQDLSVPLLVDFEELVPAVETESVPDPPVVGDPLVLNCNSSTIPSVQGTLTAVWTLPDGSNITAQGDDFVDLPLTIDPFDIADAGLYTCEIIVESPLTPFPVSSSETRTISISDQCIENNIICDANARCVNREGVLQCFCNEGFSGDGFTCTSLTTPTTDTPSNTDDGGVTVLPETVPATTPTGTTPPASTTPLPAQPTDPPSTTPPASSSPPPTDTPLTDECASDALNNCHANARCIDLNDGFRCRCLRGFTGNGVKCKDIDECKRYKNNCDTRKDCSFQHYAYYGKADCRKRARCVNTPGSFECVCNEGYQGNGRRCEDINECENEEDNCSSGALCINSPGSFECRCSAGDLGDGVSCCISMDAVSAVSDSDADRTGTGTRRTTGTRSTSRGTRRRTTRTRRRAKGRKSRKSGTSRSSSSETSRSMTADEAPALDVPAGCDSFVAAFLEEQSRSRSTGGTRTRSTSRTKTTSRRRG